VAEISAWIKSINVGKSDILKTKRDVAAAIDEAMKL